MLCPFTLFLSIDFVSDRYSIFFSLSEMGRESGALHKKVIESADAISNNSIPPLLIGESIKFLGIRLLHKIDLVLFRSHCSY